MDHMKVSQWDLSKTSDVRELFDMIAFERPVIMTSSRPLNSVFSTELAKEKPRTS